MFTPIVATTVDVVIVADFTFTITTFTKMKSHFYHNIYVNF